MAGGSEKASSAFAAELTDATAKFNEASARTAARIEEAIAAISEKVVGETSEISKQIARAAVDAGEESRMKVASAGLELANTFSDMGDQLVAGLNRLQDGLNGTVLKLSEIERGIAHHVGSIGQLSKATEDTGNALSGTARSIRDAGTPLAESARLLADASKNIADATGSTQQSVAGAQIEIRNITQLLQQTLETTSQQWQSYERRFKGVDDSLSIILDRIIKSVQENLEGLRSFVEKVDEKLSGAVDKLGGGIEDLGEFAQSMEQITLRLNRTNHPGGAQ
jgi:methyl-accepting chemotaxis protein